MANWDCQALRKHSLRLVPWGLHEKESQGLRTNAERAVARGDRRAFSFCRTQDDSRRRAIRRGFQPGVPRGGIKLSRTEPRAKGYLRDLFRNANEDSNCI